MTRFRAVSTAGLIIAVLGSSVGYSPITGLRNARASTPEGLSSVLSEAQLEPGPELWIHAMGTPSKLKQVSAKGVRLMLDLRKDMKPDGLRKCLAKYARQNLAVVVSLRWKDPSDTTRPIMLDIAPTAKEEAKAIDLLMTVLSSREAKKMEGQLWVQFYNEVVGGMGAIMPEQADGMYAFATHAAERIRKDTPYVKIIGPGLTALGGLNATSSDGPMADLHREGLLLAIDWSVANADAVDIHLHCAGGDDARNQLTLLRQGLEQAGNKDFPVVSLEWSPAKFPARDADLAGAEQAILDIFQAMTEQHVLIAAYAAFADAPLAEVFKWAFLWNVDGTPHEPFYSEIKDLAEGRQPTIADAGGSPPPVVQKSSSKSARILRKHRK